MRALRPAKSANIQNGYPRYAVVLDLTTVPFQVIVRASPAIRTFGETVEDALAMARDAIELSIAVRRDEGTEIPPPDAGEARLEAVAVNPHAGVAGNPKQLVSSARAGFHRSDRIGWSAFFNVWGSRRSGRDDEREPERVPSYSGLAVMARFEQRLKEVGSVVVRPKPYPRHRHFIGRCL